MMNSLSAMTGLPAHKPHAKKKHGPRRGKKPGGHHLANLTQAHGAGDHRSARTHALNYANEITKHLNGLADDTSTSPVGDDMDAGPSTPVTPPAPKATAGVSLAALMRSRQK